MRLVLLGMTVAITLAGCATNGNPLASGPNATQAFDTKLLNLLSAGTQMAGQTNVVPNAQMNGATQTLQVNGSAMFPIASATGALFPTAFNTTGQGITNGVAQTQTQSQLVL